MKTETMKVLRDSKTGKALRVRVPHGFSGEKRSQVHRQARASAKRILRALQATRV